MWKYNNWMIFARLGDIKQTRQQNMAEIVFSWGVSKTIFELEFCEPGVCVFSNKLKMARAQNLKVVIIF